MRILGQFYNLTVWTCLTFICWQFWLWVGVPWFLLFCLLAFAFGHYHNTNGQTTKGIVAEKKTPEEKIEEDLIIRPIKKMVEEDLVIRPIKRKRHKNLT